MSMGHESLPEGRPHVDIETIKEVNASFYDIAVELGLAAVPRPNNQNALPLDKNNVDDVIGRILLEEERRRETTEFDWFGEDRPDNNQNN